MDTAARFADFARAAESGGSPVYADWARGLASSPECVAIVERARASQRQPVLVFAVARLLGAAVGPWNGLRDWLTSHADEFVAVLDTRYTQTNDVRRAGPLAWALTRILPAGDRRPIALLEVGASAGLALYPDRSDVRVGQAHLGDRASAVHVVVDVSYDGPQDPTATSTTLPEVAYRAGLDLVPLDVRGPDDARWLETLLWPGQDERIELLRAAIGLARTDPPVILRGDAVDGLRELVALAPEGTAPVVVTSGTLVYLPGPRRQEFVDLVAELGVRWVSYERTGILTGVHATMPASAAAGLPAEDAFATLAVDGRAIATGDAHGTRLRLFA